MNREVKKVWLNRNLRRKENTARVAVPVDVAEPTGQSSADTIYIYAANVLGRWQKNSGSKSMNEVKDGWTL